MKKVTVNYLALMVATAFLASGCNGLKKMAQNANQIQRSITPSPLEMHAGKVPVSITVTFPPKYFDKKAYLVCTPALKSELDPSNEIKMKNATLQGSKVKDNNTTIDYKAGGSYTYKDTIDYSDPYRRSDLMLNMKATKGSETVDVADIKIGDGVNVTPLLVEEGLKVDNGTIGASSNAAGSGKTIDVKIAKPKSSQTTKNLTVYYPMQKAALDAKEQKKSDVSAFVSQVKNAANDANTTIKSIEVASYASPDGPEDMNENLVDQRGKTGEKFAKDQLKKVEGTSNVVSRQTTQAEDWDGFKKVTEASDLKDKDLILRVLSMYSDPTTREREIKNISAAYTSLKSSVLPKLRRSEINAILLTKEKTEAELADLAKNNFDELSQDEALYASTMNSIDNAAKVALLKKYTEKYPNDWRGFNNLGTALIRDNNLNDAETALNKAKSLDANQACIYNNLGVIDLAKGDNTKATEDFSKAKNIGCEEAGYNLGVMDIRNGEYDKAVANFGNTPSFNKALAQVLAKNVTDASTTLNSVNSQDAYVDYLKAIIASKNSNEDGVVSNLKEAVKKNSSLKDYAKNDVEFIRYFDSNSFKSVVD
jgi:tetratricopeptide (TPR) repeat protein